MKKNIDFQSLLEKHGSLWHFVQKQIEATLAKHPNCFEHSFENREKN